MRVLIFACFSLFVAPAAIALPMLTHSPVPSIVVLGDTFSVDFTIRNLGAEVPGSDDSMVNRLEIYYRQTGGLSVVSLEFAPTALGSLGLAAYDPEAAVFWGIVGLISPDATTGESDLGIDGTSGGSQFRITLQATSLGSAEWQIGDTDGVDYRGKLFFGSFEVGGVRRSWDETNSDLRFGITIIPEPSSALLVALGLAGLSAVPRRRP